MSSGGDKVYAIVVYDIGVERINKVRTFLRQHMNWVQNSVFEGELTKTELARIKSRLGELIKPDHDNILFYIVRDKKYMDFYSLGTIRAETSNII